MISYTPLKFSMVHLNISPWKPGKRRFRTWKPSIFEVSILNFGGASWCIHTSSNPPLGVYHGVSIHPPTLSAIGFVQFLLQLIISNDQGTELVEVPMQHSLSFEGSAWLTGGPGSNPSNPTWRIIPFSEWLVTPIYKPFRPFGRGINPFRGLTNHGY